MDKIYKVSHDKQEGAESLLHNTTCHTTDAKIRRTDPLSSGELKIKLFSMPQLVFHQFSRQILFLKTFQESPRVLRGHGQNF